MFLITGYKIPNIRSSLYNSRYLYYQFSENIEYMQANVDTGCCLSDGSWHRRCLCDDITDSAYCQSLCSSDSGCKGFAMLDSWSNYCQLATTSACPVGCRGPLSETNIGPIDPNAECYVGKWNGGCFIKIGILL